MIQHFTSFFFAAIVLGLIVTTLCARLATAWPAQNERLPRKKWQTAIAVLLWIAAAFFCLTAGITISVFDMFQSDMTQPNSYIARMGAIALTNATFICIALGLYVIRFRRSDTKWTVKLGKILGYGALLCAYFHFVSILETIVGHIG